MRWIFAIAAVLALAGCAPTTPSRAALQQHAQDMAVMDQQRQNAIERRLITNEITQDEYQREMAQEQYREQAERDQLRNQTRRNAAARRALLDDDQSVPTFRPSYNYGATTVSSPPVSPSLTPAPVNSVCSMMSCPHPLPPPRPKLIPYEAVAPLLPGINSQGFAK